MSSDVRGVDPPGRSAPARRSTLLIFCDSLSYYGPTGGLPADDPRIWPNIVAAQLDWDVELSRRVGRELGLPVFRYGEIGADRRPAFFRRGGLDGLIRLVDEGELEPDDGPSTIDTRSGVVLVGTRAPLVAYNVELATDDVAVARTVAAAVRASGGGMPGVQAIGLLLPESGRVQVSMNVIDVDTAPLHEVVQRVRDEAAARGVEVRAGELVGLVPASVTRAAAAAGVAIPGVDESRVLENVLRSRLAE